MTFLRLAPFAALLLRLGRLVAAAEDTVTFTRRDDRVRIEIGGRLFSEYRFRGAPKPCLYPILDADGTAYTRDYPFAVNPVEDPDHVWHRGVWFAHGLVNGHDFWREIPEKRTGSIVHDGLLETRDGPEGRLRARSRWVSADGTVVCTDETEFRVRRDAAGTWLDVAVTLRASHGPLVLGDTEEGALGVRVNELIRVVHSKGATKRPGAGQILNAQGHRNGGAWGKRAPWCDYTGTLPDGRTLGITILEHPGNPRHPTWWHVREYGLFAANPFGRHDFEKLKDQPNAGEIRLPAGGELVLRYRMFFHRGAPAPARLEEHFRDYAAGR